MKLQTVKKVIKSSYRDNGKNFGDLVRDKSLSGKRAQVYNNPKTGQTLVVHRGTASPKDWVTDVGVALGFEGGKRFRHGAKIQKQAEDKYGAKSITTIGHSLGGRIAEKVGKNTSQIITYNKAATPISVREKRAANQTDIRTKGDPISYLSKYQKGGSLVQIKSPSINPFYNHSTKPIKVDKEI